MIKILKIGINPAQKKYFITPQVALDENYLPLSSLWFAPAACLPPQHVTLHAAFMWKDAMARRFFKH
jgi:hypothetical protein